MALTAASVPSSVPLAIGEDSLARMPLRQRRRGSWIAEILGPLPVPDLRHILQVLANIVVMFIQLLAKESDCIRSLQAKPGYVLERIQRQVEAAHFVQHYHVEWSCGRSLVHIAMYMEAAFI